MTRIEYNEMDEPVELLDAVSLFLYGAEFVDIDGERQRLEEIHDCKLEAFRVSHETRSGRPATRVEWRVL